MPTDRELLRQYAEEGDEAAFAELVRRRTDFVYSAALRLTSQPQLAEDVTQTVFTKLARRVATLRRHDALASWLHTAARHSAIDAIRADARRRAREQEAFAMQNDSALPEPDWEQLRPILDEAVSQLRERDRAAVLLRFFQGLSHQQVGAELNLTEDTARKCVERALEKLRGYFARRGVGVSSVLLAAAISANSLQAAPAGLAGRAAEKSLVGATAAGTGWTTFLATLFMSTKTKILLAVAVAALLALLLTIKFQLSANNPAPTEKPSVAAASPSSAAKPETNTTQPAVALPTAKAVKSSDTANLTPVRPAVAGGTGAPPNDAATKANLRSIVSAYQAYTTSGSGNRILEANYGDSAHVAAIILAQKTGLNDAALFFTPGDPLAPKTRPKSVISGDIRDAVPEVNPEFANATLSIVIVANLPVQSPTTQPVAWTRGLREDGTWAPDSPYGGKGGYIAFFDGHSEWVESLTIGQHGTSLVTYSSGPNAGALTVNVKDTLPPGAVILSAVPNEPQK